MRSFFVFVASLSLLFGAKKDLTADLSRLANPETALNEVARLFGNVGLELELKRAWIYPAPQREGEALTLVMADDEYFFEKEYGGYNGYRIEDAEGLFEKDRPGKLITEPSLRRIEDAEIKVFDAKGVDLKFFAGNSSIDFGYVSDFNGDRILERAEGWSFRGMENFEVQVFLVATIERLPRRVLEVIYNRHPEKDSENYGWDYRCFDDNGDGLVEVGFGPRGSELDEVIFEWNVREERYLQRGGGEHPHLRVLKEGERADEVAYEFRYPLPRIESERVVKGRPYQFVSLKGARHEVFREFFNGKKEQHDFSFGDSRDDRLPDNFWEGEAKDVALAMVEANRSDKHRKEYRLVIDDRNGLEPPESGWIYYGYGSSGLQSFQSSSRALRFGGDNPALFTIEWATLGKSDRYQDFYESSSRVRKIEISADQANHLAEVFFWLDRIRSQRFDRKRVSWGGGSSHDGFGILSIYPSGSKPREMASGTIWHSGSTEGHFQFSYDQEVMLNLADLIWSVEIRRMLGEDREGWPKNFNRQEHRAELVRSISEILGEGDVGALPLEFLESLVGVIGDAGLTELEPEIAKLEKSIPASPSKEEKQLASMRGDEFSGPVKTVYDSQLVLKLDHQLRFDRAWVLRGDLKRNRHKLALLRDPQKLKEVAAGNNDWAANYLMQEAPEVLSDVIMARFPKMEDSEKEHLFRDWAMLNPAVAEDLVGQMTESDRDVLLFEIAELRVEHFPEKAREALPKLMAIIRDRDLERRRRACQIVSEMRLEEAEQDELRIILKEDVTDQGKESFWVRATALKALSQLETREGDLKYLRSQATFLQLGPKEALAILENVVQEKDDRRKVIVEYFSAQLKAETENAGEIALLALAMDLRELAPMIEAAATAHPGITNGKSWEAIKGQKFHLARYVAALWREQDEKTQARMWIDFMAGQFWRLGDESDEVVALKKMAREAVQVLGEKERGLWVNEALSHRTFKNHGEVEAWLRSLR